MHTYIAITCARPPAGSARAESGGSRASPPEPRDNPNTQRRDAQRPPTRPAQHAPTRNGVPYCAQVCSTVTQNAPSSWGARSRRHHAAARDARHATHDGASDWRTRGARGGARYVVLLDDSDQRARVAHDRPGQRLELGHEHAHLPRALARKQARMARTQTCVRARAHSHARTHAGVHARTRAHARTHTRIHAHARACTHARARTHTHAHAHAHARTRARARTHQRRLPGAVLAEQRHTRRGVEPHTHACVRCGVRGDAPMGLCACGCARVCVRVWWRWWW
jgi:hypothetical protein